MDTNFKHLIGIAGNAQSGKDTLAKNMILAFKNEYGEIACRKSIAGDQIRRDLKYICKEKFNIDPNDCTSEEKNIIRPFMVEYGRIMRNLFKGRYFIDNFIPSGYIDIIPDIRYDEYEKDELYWLKNEKNGFLIYLERAGIEPANTYEKFNNEKLRKNADIIYYIKNYNDVTDVYNDALKIVHKIMNNETDNVPKYYEY
jgi:hypothetical protein